LMEIKNRGIKIPALSQRTREGLPGRLVTNDRRPTTSD
jgi:hypothetical protein